MIDIKIKVIICSPDKFSEEFEKFKKEVNSEWETLKKEKPKSGYFWTYNIYSNRIKHDGNNHYIQYSIYLDYFDDEY
jgi:hypothetical protein